MAWDADGVGHSRTWDRGAEEEGAIEIQNKELAHQLGERFGMCQRNFEVGGQIRNKCVRPVGGLISRH